MRYVSGLVLALCIAFLLDACGDQSLSLDANVPTGAPPIVMEVSPSSATIGEEVTVIGLGYSVVPTENIIYFGETATVAESYDIENGNERLTFTVPNETPAGEYILFITVLGEPSNADTIFTIIP